MSCFKALENICENVIIYLTEKNDPLYCKMK